MCYLLLYIIYFIYVSNIYELFVDIYFLCYYIIYKFKHQYINLLFFSYHLYYIILIECNNNLQSQIRLYIKIFIIIYVLMRVYIFPLYNFFYRDIFDCLKDQ